MADIATEPAVTPASLSEHRERRAAAAAGTPAPPAVKPAPAVEQSETAGESANPNKETQETGHDTKKPRAKNATERAAELRAAGRVREAETIEAEAAEKKQYDEWKANRDAEKQRIERLERENRELREAGTRKPESPAPPAATAAATDPTRPKLKDFLAKPENKDRPYDEIVEQWKDADDEWKDTQRTARTEAEKRTQTFNQKAEALRAVHADFDQATSGENFQRTIARLAPLALQTAAHELTNGVEALYRLAKDPALCAGVAALSPTGQVIELGVMSRAIDAEKNSAPPPEKPKTPPVVSRTPPPPRSLSGIAPNEDTPKGTPRSLSEFRKQKQTRAS